MRGGGGPYTIGGTWWKAGITLAANHLLAVVFGSKSLEGRLNDTTTETEDQVEGGFLFVAICVNFPPFQFDRCRDSAGNVSPNSLLFVPSGCCSRTKCVLFHEIRQSPFRLPFSTKLLELRHTAQARKVLKMTYHPPTAFRQRSNVADLVGFLPYPGSWP